MLINDAVYSSADKHLSTSYSTTSAGDFKTYISDWLSNNLGSSEPIGFPFPATAPAQSIAYIDGFTKIFNFYGVTPVVESGSTIQSTQYAGVTLPSINVATIDTTTSRIAASDAGAIPGYIQSLVGPLNTFIGYFLVLPSSIIRNNLFDFRSFSGPVGVLSFSISFNNGTFSIASYGINYQRFSLSTTELNQYWAWNNITAEPYTQQSDPYVSIVGGSTTGGGGGSGDFTGQTIGEPSLPLISALNSGFISAYAPSVSNLNQLASYMWTSDFADNLKKVFGDNPMNTILGLSSVPVQPPLGGGSTVILGNIDTGISMPTIGAQYTKVNCGSIAIEPKYGAFLDYEPYTSIDLFLPYIGMVQLSTNDVMGKSLGVVYTVDVLSGACVANVSCGGSIMYTFEGACATQFPVTNNDYSNVFKAAVDAASSIVGAVGGAVASGMTGNVAGAVTSIVDGAAGAATAAMNAHPTVNRSGSLSGSAGLMGIQHPFIVWTTPNMVASNRQNSFIGYPNFITTTLSGCAGYTEVENINLGIAGATSEEIAEIKALLKNGVIF